MKRGGSKPAYADQFNLLSPCYKDAEQPAGFHMGGAKTKSKRGKTTKKPTTTKGKASKRKSQKGGSTCYASPSVSEMGVIDKPSSLEPSASELAWNKRMTGGANGNVKPNSKTTSNLFKMNASLLGNTLQAVNNSVVGNTLQAVNNSVVGNTLQAVNNSSKNNGVLNKIKNDVLPLETISGFAIIVKKTNKNNTNSKNHKYSIEIISKKENENTEIKKLDKSEFAFYDISQELRKISTEVFPPPKPETTTSAATATVNGNAAVNGTAARNAAVKVNAAVNGNAARNAAVKVNAARNAAIKVNGNAAVKVNNSFGLSF